MVALIIAAVVPTQPVEAGQPFWQQLVPAVTAAN
jgi:hypothetical protein